ncbi:MAG: ribosome biogenesis GTPase YlqF [Peptostreptococcaceae bacterium]|nr:ribosome biogenesis GTPase YlqF [Peptostreptococcaceae bacterium]
MNINWYPGHMKKTRELIQENIKLVDVVIEIIDARLPFSSKNPQIDTLFINKPKIIAINKMDLADPRVLHKFQNSYKEKGFKVVNINSMTGEGTKELLKEVEDAAQGLFEKLKKKGMKKRAIRIMIIGIPNVGKSSLINKLVGKKSARTGDKPGVTRGKQWVRIKKDIELFDTPGILWPKFENQNTAIKLALSGAIKDELIPFNEAARWLISFLRENYRGSISSRYEGVDESASITEIIEAIGKKRGCILKGGVVDLDRAVYILVDDYRRGRLGRIVLDRLDGE